MEGLTRKILHSGISRVALYSSKNKIKNKDDIESQFGSVLALHLQCKGITTITLGALDPFYSLKNLYLYKNNIRRIQGLDSLNNLEFLDLSRNNVERIDNLDKCVNLRKLYVGFNEIQVVEGIENLESLEELIVHDQDIPSGQPLIFSPGIMASVTDSLLLLDISSNQLTSLDPIANLPLLDTLLASDNEFQDFALIVPVLESLRSLRVLTLKGNPIASRPNYKSQVIGSVYKLELLDGKDVNHMTRTCVQKFRLVKEYRNQKKVEAKASAQLQTRQNEMNASEVTSRNLLEAAAPTVGADFQFSTPTRRSPQASFPSSPDSHNSETPKLSIPSKLTTSPKTSLGLFQSRKTEKLESPFDTTSYSFEQISYRSFPEPPNPADQMSDMARIIFRLSNLDQEDPRGGGDASQINKRGSYWDTPGSSMPKECRPLSPLEGLDLTLSPPKPSLASVISTSKSSLTSPSRPKPAAPGGRRCSNNSNAGTTLPNSITDFTLSSSPDFQQNSFYSKRTLSPLMEMPTPESLTARDDQSN